MKKWCVLAFSLVASVVMAMPSNTIYSTQWKEADAAVEKGLPKTAIEKIEPIIQAALKDKTYAEAIRAIGIKIALEGNIEGNKPEEKVVRLLAAISNSPSAMQPVMEAILANWYWHYFEQNRWRFMNRTQTAEAPSADFTTWDLPRILAEIDSHFQKALAAEAQLKKIPIAEYDSLLEKGTMPDSCRPTLWDFVAHDAIDFYSVDEHAGSQAEDAFVLQADSPIFDHPEDFLKWRIETTDDNASTVKALRLYQNLLSFHKNCPDWVSIPDASFDAVLDADLLRLEYGERAASGETKAARYRDALKDYAERNHLHPFSARARADWARIVWNEDHDAVTARAIAAKGLADFPKSVGGDLCYNIIQEIEARDLQLSSERVWNACKPDLVINYRNLTNVYFRVYAADFEARMNHGRNVWQSPNNLDSDEAERMLKSKPVLEWTTALPATTNFQMRTQRLNPPPDLKPGYYIIFSAARADFAEKNDVVSYTSFWVSDLALIVRDRNNEACLEGLVLDAASGEPIPGAEVGGWSQTGDKRNPLTPITTDVNGFFRFDGTENHSYLLLATHGAQKLAMSDSQWLYRSGKADPTQSQTIFFTDRSIYRPGQIIRYKGICVSADQTKAKYAVLPDTDVTVIFQDQNNKEIARQTHRANAFGSFDGSFTAPRDRLTGYMSLHVNAGPKGNASVRVEEYKRPKFQVSMDAPKEASKLNSDVVVTGHAKTYTDMPVANAKVNYRVVREVRFPLWWRWCCFFWGSQQTSQEITHGVATTKDDGSFTVRFTARPAPDVDPKSEATFSFSVNADVTDTTGETRSGEKGVIVGFTALQADMTADEWQTVGTPVSVKISTRSLDGDPISAKGTIKIYRLVQPEKVVRAPLSSPYNYRYARGVAWGKNDDDAPTPDRSDPNTWALGDVVAEKTFNTDTNGQDKLEFPLDVGAYRAMLTTQDAFGKEVTTRLPLLVIDERASAFVVHVPNHVAAAKWSVQPGETFRVLWGSGYNQARAFIELESQGRVLRQFWTGVGRTQEIVPLEITEALRGSFVVRVTSVHENRAYMENRVVSVPWDNQNLALKWEHFVSKLGPGKKEIWTAVVSGTNATRVTAEVVATLYDASLDAFMPHSWPAAFNVFRQEWDNVRPTFANATTWFNPFRSYWSTDSRGGAITYREFPPEISHNLAGYGYFGCNPKYGGGGGGLRMMRKEPAMEKGLMVERAKMCNAFDAPFAPSSPEAAGACMQQDAACDKPGEARHGADPFCGASGATHDAHLDHVTARKNLDETAFFFPHLTTDENGVVRMEFTMPEALTEWKFMAFAHDKSLRAGFLQDRAVTAKDLMVEPNPPRFVREGDTLEFTVKVSNRSQEKQKGSVRLTFTDTRTLAAVDKELKNLETDESFNLSAGESKTFSWRITVPDGMGFLTYKAVGAVGDLSDGEEGSLPVLSRRILVTESLPLPIRGAQTKQFAFNRLLDSAKSDTLRNQSLTVQMVSQPAWYAVMALPYLMEYPYECSEQVFNRLYANALARHIAKSDPKIRRVFDLWKNTTALDSPLEKNQDLKSVMIEDTPWYRQAQDEKQARHNVGVLFDDNRLNDEMSHNQSKLAEMQYADGRWPWFPGGHPNEYITLYVATGYGRLRHLGVKLDMAPALKAWGALDNWIDEQYREILRQKNKDGNNLTSSIALYLYGRSFFLGDCRFTNVMHREAVDYFLDQARKHWLRLNCRQSQAHLALALQRFGDAAAAKGIMASIRERSVSNEEIGMFWRDTELSWWWYRAPIETQAVMVEAFDEIENDAAAVESCKVWLLKQKQTQDWKTTKATADAVYALLLRGSNMLASDALVEVALDGQWIKPENVEAGTGFYEQRFTPAEIKPAMGKITVKKTDEGASWGSVHWQYLEDMTKVTPYDGTPLKVVKKLFIKENTKKGPELRPVKSALEVGQELVVRIELRTDRDMEYVHLKDQRGAGTEPVNVLSHYKYQDGLAYYESTRDTASHFYIDYLPKGVYVFEYSMRIVHRGAYQSGIAEVQCLYAPEFNSHSESFNLVVK
jgi:uncharacterized protein YfaS (alpha-2-macroglobulin family)